MTTLTQSQIQHENHHQELTRNIREQSFSKAIRTEIEERKTLLRNPAIVIPSATSSENKLVDTTQEGEGEKVGNVPPA
ncbi:hypothetical protein V6N13_127353 [Hibiscus sabdariffa]